MTALFIGENEQIEIEKLIKRARAATIPWEVLRAGAIADPGPELKFADRKPGFERPPSFHLILPTGFRCALSFEEQPAGIVRHLSVSLHRDTKLMPHPAAITMIAKAFGFTNFPPPEGRVWMEEFEPGRYAINVIEVVEARQAGHA